MIKSIGSKNCNSFYCDPNVGCPTGCTCSGNQCVKNSNRTYSRFTGAGQTPLNYQPQWSNDGTRSQVFVGVDGTTMTPKSMSDKGTHTMPDGTVMRGASHSEGYGSIFSKKSYWIGVVAGVVSLMAYQKYIK